MTKAYSLLIFGFILGCFADVFLCRWAKAAGGWACFAAGLLLYTADTAFWAMSIRAGLPFWRAGLLWTLGSLVLCVAVGLCFSERPSAVNWIGIGLAIAAVILIEVES